MLAMPRPLRELIQMVDFTVLGFCDFLKGATPQQRHFDGVRAAILIVRDHAKELYDMLDEINSEASDKPPRRTEGEGEPSPTA